jgi:hypothetical protein
MLHQIYMTQIGNDNIHKGLETIYGDNNIHSSPYMAREKVGNFFLYMSSILWHNSYNNISKRILGCSALTPAWIT